MIEHWKSVPSKLGVIASSFGRIKLPDSVAKMPSGVIREYNPKPTYGVKTKASKTARHEYMAIANKKFGNMKVHRLVCEAFHGPAPFAGAVVIHINEDATNNRPENLRWGTQKENLNMPKFIAYCKTRTGENSSVKKGMKTKK